MRVAQTERAEAGREAAPPDAPARGWVLDLVGAGIAAAVVGWGYVAAGETGGDPGPLARLLLGAAAVYGATRLVGRVGRWPVPIGISAAGLVIFLGAPGPTLNDYALGGPLLYSNARGGFFALAVGAGLMAAAAASGRRWAEVPLAIAGLGAAAVMVVVPFGTGTHAGMIAVGSLVTAAVVAGSHHRARVVVVAAAAAFAATLAVTIWLAASFEGPGGSGVVDRLVTGTALKEHRVEGWADALTIMVAHPLTGVGSGRYHEASSLARDTFYERNARHGFLLAGAEMGVPGMVLVVSVFAWGFARLWARPRPDRVTALGAVALASLGMHACVDFVLVFPIPVLTAAALTGTAVAVSRAG